MDLSPFRLTHPEPAPPKPKPPAPQGADPFRVEGPAIISFSGGRSSAMMLHHILDRHDGQLPPDVVVNFSNTGAEREETLEFVREVGRRWSVPIRWTERDASRPEGFREVTFETASRRAEPFEALIRQKSYLPNADQRFCTVFLKLFVARDLMLSLGYEAWDNIVGFRADEPARVAKLAARNAAGEQEWLSRCPLYDAGVIKAGVFGFWRTQPFDLALQPHESNCTLCPIKKRKQRERIVREHPEFADWWLAMEKLIGGRFVKSEPHGYAGMMDRVFADPERRVVRLSVLPTAVESEDDEDTDESVACGCTDRRPARPTPMRAALVPCTCGAFAGEGHALRCDRVFGGEVAA